MNCIVNASKTSKMEIRCEPGFDGGLPQHFSLLLVTVKDNLVLVNTTNLTPVFSMSSLQTNQSSLYRAYIHSVNAKGKSEVLVLPDIVLGGELSDLNGPITRAAQEGNSDSVVKTGNALAELQEFDPRNEPESPLVSILCGVVSAIVVVFIVIAVTMRIRCGRRAAESTWRKDCSSESSFEISPNSPDLLVKNVAGKKYKERNYNDLILPTS